LTVWSLLMLFIGAGTFIQTLASERHVVFDGSAGARLHADIHVGAGGTKAPMIVLLHQGGGDARGEYGPIIPRLIAGGFNVMAVDLRGGGERFGSRNRTLDEWKGPKVSYCDEYADVVAAVRYLQDTGFSGPRVIWGSSYTATLGIRLAAEQPSVVAGVLAFSPAGSGPMEPCKPSLYIPRLQRPLLVLRPAAESEAPHVRQELALVERHGGAIHVARPGAHGSSMLVADRVAGSVEREWDVVSRFLARVTRSVTERGGR
jgi:pimeloyl-ACP methyl ester carboxylesterase